jgi:hypothetical protein
MVEDELFEQIGEDDYRCIECKATTIERPSLIEGETFDSYGGTTEGYERCTACGASRSWADLSAVI